MNLGTWLNALSRLPLGLLYLLSNVLYFLLVHVVRYRVDIVDNNLKACFPSWSHRELNATRRSFYKQVAQILVEVVAARRLPQEALLKRVHFENPEVVEELKRADQPFILLAAHQCNWEWLLLAMCARFSVPIDAIYKPLSQTSVDEFMLAVRSRFGASPVPKKEALFEIMRRRGQMRVFAMVADQAPVLVRETHWLKFLGRDTPFQVGVQKVAAGVRYPVVFVGMRRISRGHYVAKFQEIGSPPYDKQSYELVNRYAELVEEQIKDAPSDWLWTNRRWKHKKPLYD